jgi:hypothetical protein
LFVVVVVVVIRLPPVLIIRHISALGTVANARALLRYHVAEEAHRAVLERCGRIVVVIIEDAHLKRSRSKTATNIVAATSETNRTNLVNSSSLIKAG